MQKGDNILINYNTASNLQKIATFNDKIADNNYFFDINGLFILSDGFIKRQGITFTVIAD